MISLKPRLNKPNLGDPTVRIKDFRSTLNPASASCSSWSRVVVVPPPRSHIVSRLAVWSRCLSRLYDFHSKSFLGTITMKSVAARASPTSLIRSPKRPQINSIGARDPQAQRSFSQIRSLTSTPSASRSPTYFRVPRHSLKMLRGSLALTGYRPFNEQPSPPLHSHHVRSTLCPWGPGGLGRPFG